MKKAIEKQECALKLKDIVKVYGTGSSEVHALKKINISFRKNEFVSILGPSGCGKTTMLNIIGGLDRYTSGDLIINGKSTKEYKDGDWDTYRNNSIGFVFQSYNLIPHQSVIANVELALTLSGVSKAERRKRAHAVIEKVGLKGQENKKPNQLSGGQMQRVAIARALINNPEIILADEPTGALDTETSIQVMDLLKEVAKDRLVIMVTHNPELAEKYSTRIIRLLDGKKTDDTNPFNEERESKERIKADKKGKASMKFATAFALSLSNLRTKRGRTVLTAIAGSIGIIGIALVLAVSTGFSAYINKLQADTLSAYPVTVEESTVDFTDFNKLLEDQGLEKFPAIKEVVTKELMSNLTNMLKSNDVNQEEYLRYIDAYEESENGGKDGWQVSVKKKYNLDVNNFVFTKIKTPILKDAENLMAVDAFVQYLEQYPAFSGLSASTGISTSFVRQYIPTMSEIPDCQELIESQYDLLEGSWATKEGEVLLVLDQYNSIPDITLAMLGIKEVTEMNGLNIKFSETPITFEDIMEHEFYYVNLDNRYELSSDVTDEDGIRTVKYKDLTFTPKKLNNLKAEEKAFPIKISGIVRLKNGVQQGVLDFGIAYTHKLVERILKDGNESEMAKVFNGEDAVNSVTILDPCGENLQSMYKTSYTLTERQLGCSDQISGISFYTSSYDAKENLKTYLDAWNDKDGIKDTEKEVHYSDSTSMLFSALNSIVDGVKIVLICFTSISLIVSSIMIGIITYVSVVERTKEIGVLRALGARKKDISRIFNAETFSIGLLAGLIGIGITYLLTIPINLLIGKLIDGMGSLAILNPIHALLLICVSFVLTLIAGIIPSRIAAKKDPVVALRTE